MPEAKGWFRRVFVRRQWTRQEMRKGEESRRREIEFATAMTRTRAVTWPPTPVELAVRLAIGLESVGPSREGRPMWPKMMSSLYS